MNDKDEQDEWRNELMDLEEELIGEMQIEFRDRLQKRLQEKIDGQEQQCEQVRGLKKNDGSGGPSDQPSAS